MSDLFHKDIPLEFITRVFDVMEEADWHTYQILTKRSECIRDFANSRYKNACVPSHIWLGTSVENRSVLNRIEHLRQTPTSVRFLSFEPLLESLGRIDLSGIDWVIVGGESGPAFRTMEVKWAQEIRDQCVDAGVAFFFKQWGGIRPKSGGNLLDGREWAEFPNTQALQPV